MNADTLSRLPGGGELCAYYDGRPPFHDAQVPALVIAQGGTSLMTVRMGQMTQETDADGHLLYDRLVEATFTLEGELSLELHEIKDGCILDDLEIEAVEGGVRLSFESSYGAFGWLQAERVSVSFQAVEGDNI